ncbi:MAG: hypothetical protein HC892_12100, partial [Saprospiraceae bacterium]|nr:hypothetical protein [Saprospiraceae bacterium]
MSNIKLWVFLPPLSILVAAAIFSLVDVTSFLSWATYINNWLLDYFGWLYSLSTLFFLIICTWVYVSPIGQLRIGGKEAVPFLTRWRCFYFPNHHYCHWYFILGFCRAIWYHLH